ncbi:cytospin-A-like [Palaemon carinicauda]|uniref:cytospin-A-like n=1 Tax=Palaemon carinicauda TaxID=392227 RepID=UPI0035B59FE0
MDRGRPSGVGGSKGLVAGVKAALKPRSQSVKSHSKSQIEERDEEAHKQSKNDITSMSSKSHRSPKSPFAGWKRSRSKEKTKKDSTKSKDTKANRNNAAGPCSKSQAERLSAYVSDDYSSYGSDASEMLRDIQTGRYTSFRSHSESHDRRISKRVMCEQPSTADRPWPVPDSYVKEPEDPYSKELDYCFANGRYVNLPTGCFGVPCAGFQESGTNSFNASNENSFESGNTLRTYNYNGNVLNPIHTVPVNNEQNHEIKTYDLERECVEKSYQRPSFSGTNGVTYNLWGGNHQLENIGTDDQNFSEGSSCAIRVRGDGSEAQDVISPEVKIEEEIRVGGSSSLTMGRQPWLKSALNYNLEVPEFPRNEVVVLALGIDQYIEEVFRYLDHGGDGKVHVEDFKALCNVLGLKDKLEENRKSYSKRCQCMGSNLTLNGSANNSLMNANNSRENECPVHLSFTEFHNNLCESFIMGAKTESVIPLASRRPTNPKLVTSVVQVQRRYDVLDNIAKSLDEVSAGLDADENKMIAECPAAGVVCCKCQQSAIQQQHVDKNSNIALQPVDSEHAFLKKQVLLQQQELQCLREVIEDMRVALQSSDAENLALQVKTLRSHGPSLGSSTHDLSLTDEEDTIDDLVKQLTALSKPNQANQCEGTSHTAFNRSISSSSKGSQTDIEGPNTSEDPLNTAFISGDYSLEKELQATYEALQAAREEREATQADLQRVVGDLQERERDLQGAELSLKAAHTALEKVQYDNQALVMEIAETRSHLEDTRQKLLETTENLQVARESILQKEKLLKEAHIKLNKIRNSRERVVECVCSARNLVAGSLDQVRAGEQALNSLVALSAFSLQHETFPYSKPQRLDTYCRADSGLYSEESEREDDRGSPERFTGHNSASEDDLWFLNKSKENLKETQRHNHQNSGSSTSSYSPNSLSSPASEYDSPVPPGQTSPVIITELEDSQISSAWPKTQRNGLTPNSTEIIEGLERELRNLQQTLEEAELEWKQETTFQPQRPKEVIREETALLENELREVEAERMRLALIEEKLRQLLQVLLSVADLNLSRRTLGRLVLEAVEDAAGVKFGDIGFSNSAPEDGKVSPLTFLTNLLSSTSNYQALSTESLMQLAFQGLSFPPCIPELPEPIEATLG